MRKLSPIEQALTVTNVTFPMCVVCVIKLQNGPAEAKLQSALNQLANHFPLLQAYIIDKSGGFRFERAKGKEIKVPLQLIARTSSQQWKEVARNELNAGFDHCKFPLIRAVYLKPLTKQSEIILSFHHAIVDSVFLMTFIDQLLTLVSDETTEKLNSYPGESPLLTDVLPGTFKLPRLLVHLLPFLVRQIKAEIEYKTKSGGEKDQPIPVSSNNDIQTLSFSEEETLALIRWTRKYKLSLYSVLTAAMLWVVNHYKYDDRKSIMRTAQFASLRNYLKPPVSRDVEGCFIAMMRFNVIIAKGQTISQIASGINRRIISSKSGDKFLFSLLSKILIRKSFRDKKERLSHTALSYAGPVKLRKQYGQITVDDMHGFITNNSLGPELTGFGKIIFNRLSLDLNYLPAETSQEEAQKMVSEMKKLLLQLTEEK